MMAMLGLHDKPLRSVTGTVSAVDAVKVVICW
jgi:hypothetical protein